MFGHVWPGFRSLQPVLGRKSCVESEFEVKHFSENLRNSNKTSKTKTNTLQKNFSCMLPPACRISGFFVCFYTFPFFPMSLFGGANV